MANRTRTLNDSTMASEPGGITLSARRLRRLRPDLFGWAAVRRWLGLVLRGKRVFPIIVHLREALRYGDGRAAVVVSLQPLRIAAYSDEIDGVVMLGFDPALAGEFGLVVGARLLVVNTYGKAPRPQEDLAIGPEYRQRWQVIHPLIADFLTDDAAALAARKQRIAEEEWRDAEELGRAYLLARPDVARDGRPMFASRAAIPTGRLH